MVYAGISQGRHGDVKDRRRTEDGRTGRDKLAKGEPISPKMYKATSIDVALRRDIRNT